MYRSSCSGSYRLKDRRRHPRVLADFMLFIERLDQQGGMAHGQDMSLGGLRFQCIGFSMALAELVRVQFTLGDKTFSIFGRTSRVSKLDNFAQEVALTFTGMKPDLRALLQHKLYSV